MLSTGASANDTLRVARAGVRVTQFAHPVNLSSRLGRSLNSDPPEPGCGGEASRTSSRSYRALSVVMEKV